MRRQSKGFGLQLAWVALVVGVAATTLHAAPTIVDLTDPGAHDINGAIWAPVDPHSTGTGVFDPFVRIQNNDVQTGYNTGGTVEFDTKAGTWTHAVMLGDLSPSAGYYEFLLDANQNKTADGRLLSIDELIIRLETAGDLDNWASEIDGQGVLVYSLDTAENDLSVKIDYDLYGQGSGTGDIRVLIPADRFTGPATQYIYLYAVMGEEFLANDGFEEWGVRAGGTPPPPPPVPAPGAILLAGLGVGLVGWLRQRKSL